MQLDLNNLPSDTVLLHRLVRDMASVVARRDGEIERLQLIIKQLQRARFGRRSERIDADQLALGLEDVETDKACAEAAQQPAAKPKDGKPRRKPLPDHLPREEVQIDVGTETCACCGGALHPIGESVSEMLDWVPAQLRVIRIRRPKYGCRTCGTLCQAPAPERPIAGGLATPALLAQVLVSKYCDHTPLYRQSQILRVTALSSIVRRWPAGSVAPAGGSTRCTKSCAPMSLRRITCLPTTRQFPCSIPVVAAPRRVGSGSMRVINGRGVEQHRRLQSTCLRLIARANARRRISSTSPGCCTSTAMPASSGCRLAAMLSWPLAE